MRAGTTQCHDPTRDVPPTERRQGRRHNVNRGIACFISSPLQVLVPATVLNLSEKGVGLLAESYFEPGGLISITMCRGSCSQPVYRIAQVAHCREQPGGFHLLGGRFVNELSLAEFTAMLGG